MSRTAPALSRTCPSFRPLSVAVLTLALGAPVMAAMAQEPAFLDENTAPQTSTLADPRPKAAPKPVRPVPSQELGLDLVAVPEVRLGELDVAALLREDAELARRLPTKVQRYAVGRELDLGAADGHWYDLPGGALWVTDVVATDALGVRLHFTGVRLPEGAEIVVYAPDDRARAERYGPVRAAAGELWTPTIVGERARVEYRGPAVDGAGDGLPFAIDLVQHAYVDPVSKALGGGIKAAGACNNDVSCHPEWAGVANAVAGVGSVDFSGAGLFCTGQLLNAQKPDLTPYFLTANHCLSTPGEAASTELFWFYQTSSCGGPPPSLANVQRSIGATLLATGDQSDFTLLLVEGALPPGVSWAGWTSAKLANGTPATAVHHPSGDFKRISFGESGGDTGVCFNRSEVRINWTNAITEPGSSGSGIFTDAKQQLFGQLHGGASACGVAPQDLWDCYGAFSVTFPRVKKQLKGGSDDKLEQNDTCARAKNVRAGRQAGLVVKSFDQDWFKAVVPKGKTLTVGLELVHANGDVDLHLHQSCAGAAVAVSEGTGDSEAVTFTNTGKKNVTVFWRAFLASDTRAGYNMTVSIN